MNKKLLVFGIPLLCLALVTAGLVTYLSNSVHVGVEVESPMSIEFVGEVPSGIYAGDDLVFTTVTTNHASVDVEGVLVEVKVPNFDGIGITYFHDDGTWSGDIPVCTSGDDAYYYVGPAGGFTAPVGYEITATSTITASTTLKPGEYNAEIKVITAGSRVCP